MFDKILQQVNSVGGITVCGLSIGTVIAMMIVLFCEIRKAHKEARITKDAVEKAFQNVILPTKIKIDVSNKIQEPLETGFLQIKQYLRKTIYSVERGEQLILHILSQFSHVNKLPVEIQNEIAEYLDSGKSTEVKLE